MASTAGISAFSWEARTKGFADSAAQPNIGANDQNGQAKEDGLN